MGEIVKISKERAHYRGTIGQARCGSCVFYHPSYCDMVQGAIEAHKVCDRWVKK